MSSSPPLYRLVVFDAVDDPQQLRDVVCRATGMHGTDAVQWLARTPGTWSKPLEERAVRELLDGFYEAGIAAEAWRADQYPELNPARTVHRAACLDDGLRIEGLRAEPTHWIPWDRIELICAGRIYALDEFRHVQSPQWPSVVVSGIRALALLKPRPSARRARATRIPRDPVGEVIVVRRDPRIAFRVVENKMNYAYLGEDRSQTAGENFPVFVADLCHRSKHAFITPSTRALLEPAERGDCQFPSSQSLLDYATHRLLWSWYRRDRDAQMRLPETNSDAAAEGQDPMGDQPDEEEQAPED
jgi:hypothetical protein